MLGSGSFMVFSLIWPSLSIIALLCICSGSAFSTYSSSYFLFTLPRRNIWPKFLLQKSFLCQSIPQAETVSPSPSMIELNWVRPGVKWVLWYTHGCQAPLWRRAGEWAGPSAVTVGLAGTLGNLWGNGTWVICRISAGWDQRKGVPGRRHKFDPWRVSMCAIWSLLRVNVVEARF